MLALAALALAQVTPTSASDKPVNLSEEFYYASTAATGSRLCDRARSERYTAQFNKRYGERVRKMFSYHDATAGRDPDFIILSSCIRFHKSGKGQDSDHAIAMDRFETTLRKFEHDFGPPMNR